MSRFTSHIVKKILGVLIIVGCSGIFLNGYVGVNEAHAIGEGQIATERTESTSTDTGINDAMGLRETLNVVLKLIYLLLWPLLVVAGLSLDNTLIYASIFHLDAPLRKFRNMMKNFANFTLGFMVLFAIIKSILSGSGGGSVKDEKTPLGIIKKTLIAGVLIQASRFLMAALVDVSTIATYAVGGLPLSVLKHTEIGNQKILAVHSQMDLDKFSAFNERNEGFKVRYSTTYKGKPMDISPCLVKDHYIIGREFGDAQFKHTNEFLKTEYEGLEVCVVFTNQLAMWKEDKFMEAILQEGYRGNVSAPVKKPTYNDENGYKAYMKNLTNITGWQYLPIVQQYAINLDSGSKAPGIVMGSGFFNQTISMTISELINKSKGFVGPLVTMYSSLLNFAQLTDTQTTTLGETSGIFLIKSLVAIALFFPLLALAVVLVARIGLLWLYIAGSPFLIIKAVFDKLIPKEALGNLDKHLDLGNVIKLVFAPVVTVVALSISLIFMTALLNGFKADNNQQISSNIAENLSITPIKTSSDSQKFRIADTQEVEFKNFDRGGSLDRFSRLVVNFFAIGILWTILFAAIKANALGEKIGGGIQDFGANVFQTLPIIPFNKGEQRVGVGSMLTQLREAPERRVQNRESEQRSKVRDWIEGTGETRIITAEEAGKIITSTATQESITQGIQSLGVKPGMVDESISASTESLATAINAITDATTRTNLENYVYAASGGKLKADWLKEYNKSKLDTYINSITPLPDQKALTTLFNNAQEPNKTTINNYFAVSSNNQYTTTINGQTYTVTKNGNTYTVALQSRQQ